MTKGPKPSAVAATPALFALNHFQLCNYPRNLLCAARSSNFHLLAHMSFNCSILFQANVLGEWTHTFCCLLQVNSPLCFIPFSSCSLSHWAFLSSSSPCVLTQSKQTLSSPKIIVCKAYSVFFSSWSLSLNGRGEVRGRYEEEEEWCRVNEWAVCCPGCWRSLSTSYPTSSPLFFFCFFFSNCHLHFLLHFSLFLAPKKWQLLALHFLLSWTPSNQPANTFTLCCFKKLFPFPFFFNCRERRDERDQVEQSQLDTSSTWSTASSVLFHVSVTSFSFVLSVFFQIQRALIRLTSVLLCKL